MRARSTFSILITATALGLSVAAGTARAQGRGGSPPPVPAILQNYPPVTAERLLNPEPENWLMLRRTYNGWGYSPLNQINRGNVDRLRPVWVFSTGEARPHESPPIVNNGVMFVTTPTNVVIALDVRTGNELWRYRRPFPEGANVPHQVNRGVALYEDKVYVAAGDAVLIALDAKTGREVWSTTVADNSAGYYITLAPLIADGKVMVGASGGEYGIRGFVAAFDAFTGEELWRTFTVPAPGEPGSETWQGDDWRTGGAPVWVTGNYDPEANLAYFGTGNGGPNNADQRPGDNLYSTSTIVLDVATGEMKGHFQYHPNDAWDWDEVSPPLLIDYQRDGETVKGLVDVARDGYIWWLERSGDGPLTFREGKPYVYNNAFTSLDPVTGRPAINPDAVPGTGRRATFCPAVHGGKNWPPVAFNPETRMIYIPATDNMCRSLEMVEVEYTPGRAFVGVRGGRTVIVDGADHFGEVQAWNVDTGEKVWTHEYEKTPNWGSMLTTAGGLVFTGGTADRKIHAFDAASGELLWESPTSSGILAPPTTFMVDGKQYLAVHSGWGGDARGVQAQLNGVYPGEYPPIPEGGSVWVFALE